MRSKRIFALVLSVLTLLPALSGCGETAEPEEPRTIALEDGTRTIGYYSDGELLQNIPDMETEGFYGSVLECNNSCHMATYNSTTLEEYEKYIALLERQGYTLAADNGPNGIHQDVYYTALQKDETTIHLVYQALPGRTYVIVGDKEQLSPHLTDSDSYRAGIRDDIKTSLTLLDPSCGSALAMILQLRNGHFICIDSGEPEEASLILKYLQEMAPAGEKPVVEAWFLTHGHNDHYGGLKAFSNSQQMCDAIAVNGIYFNKPNNEHMTKENSESVALTVVDYLCTLMMKDENGQPTRLYRPVMGQRYYFCDVTIEITNSTEFVPYFNSTTDFNETSTTFIINVEGQKVQIMGDAETGCQYNMMNSFRSDYFALDIYQVSHHGWNTLSVFVDYVAYIKTCMDPSHMLVDAVCEDGATPYLMEHSEEFFYQGRDRGTMRATFPYEVGSMEFLGYEFASYPNWKVICAPMNYGRVMEVGPEMGGEVPNE